MENKKGFWASLFSKTPKCKCSGDVTLAVENVIEKSATAYSDIKEIKILGPGCAKCKSTFSVVEKVLNDAGSGISLVKVDDIEEIMKYNIMTTPAIVIDGKVVMKGKVPAESEVKTLLGL